MHLSSNKAKFILMIFAAILIAGCSRNYPTSPVSENVTEGPMMKKSDDGITRKIIVLKQFSSKGGVEKFVKSKGGNVERELKIINAVAVSLPAQASDKAVQALLDHYDVERVDNDFIISAPKPGKGGGNKSPKPQPAEVTPWGIDRIDAELVWGTNTADAVKVGMIDTGIDTDHPDLLANIKGGANFVQSAKSYEDDNGHGTHVAGIIAAVHNTIGVVGVSIKADLYAVKCLDRKGNGWLSDIIAGLQWCVDNNIQVINMSLGSTSSNTSFHDAIKAAYDAGITIVAAAGNDYYGSVEYPAKYPETIAVSASDINDNFASFSNLGSEVDLIAPGVNIESTYKGGGYKELSGTSMSTPHVVGVAALVIQANPTYSPDQVRAKLKSTAQWISTLTAAQQGAGMVDAETAIQ